MVDNFQAFSTTHAIAVLVCLVFAVVFLRYAATARRESHDKEYFIRLLWVASAVILQSSAQVWALHPDNLDLERTLPLHICDLAPWIGIAALMLEQRWLKSIAYFWGLGLCIWAVISPGLLFGPLVAHFWFYWIGHMQIVATAVYLVMVLDFRPTLRDFRMATVAVILYAVLVLPIDLWLPADYGFLGKQSAAAVLGQWPARIAILIVGEIAIFALLLAPWLILERRAKQLSDS